MERAELAELHFITPIGNVRSILERGIVCNGRSRRIEAQSVATAEFQAMREQRCVPTGGRLHDYANLYLCARNPMLHGLRHMHAEICVLRVMGTILDEPGVFVTDRSAASRDVRFAPAPAGLSIVDRALTFADRWAHPGDGVREAHHKSAKCAEVLVPDHVPPAFVFGAYASNPDTAAELVRVGDNLEILLNRDMFLA